MSVSVQTRTRAAVYFIILPLAASEQSSSYHSQVGRALIHLDGLDGPIASEDSSVR